jgi:hypothetical protein
MFIIIYIKILKSHFIISFLKNFDVIMKVSMSLRYLIVIIISSIIITIIIIKVIINNDIKRVIHFITIII